MAEETPATPSAAPVEPAPADTTPAAETKPETTPEPPKPDIDWERAYKGGVQTNINKLHERVENVLAQNAALAESLRVIQQGQVTVLKETAGEDRAREFEAQQVRQTTAAAQVRAQAAAEQALKGQFNVLVRAITAAGLDPKDRSLWPEDTNLSPNSWYEEAGRLIEEKLTAKKAEERTSIENAVKAKSAKEITAEAEALLQRKEKEEGRIDTSKGSASTSLLDRIRSASKNPEQLQRMIENAKSGRPI